MVLTPKQKALELQQWLIEAIWAEVVVDFKRHNPAPLAPYVVTVTNADKVKELTVEICYEGLYSIFSYSRLYSESERKPHEYEFLVHPQGKFSSFHLNSAETIIRRILLNCGHKLNR